MTLIAESDRPLSAVDIEQALNIPKTTVFRILKSLCHEQMITKKCRLYIPGNSLINIGLQLVSTSRLRNRAMPILHKLAKTTGYTAHLAVPSGYYTLILEVCDSTGSLRVASRPGTSASLHCSATGKIFIAHLFLDRIEELHEMVGFEKRTIHTITTIEELKAEALKVLAQGYGMDDLEYNIDIRCQAVPLFDHHGDVIAAIGVTSPCSNFPREKIPYVTEMLKGAASEIYHDANLGAYNKAI